MVSFLFNVKFLFNNEHQAGQYSFSNLKQDETTISPQSPDLINLCELMVVDYPTGVYPVILFQALIHWYLAYFAVAASFPFYNQGFTILSL